MSIIKKQDEAETAEWNILTTMSRLLRATKLKSEYRMAHTQLETNSKYTLCVQCEVNTQRNGTTYISI